MDVRVNTFEEIPKRKEKMTQGKDRGFWFNIRRMTNALGNSSFLNVVVAVATPIILRMLSTLVVFGFVGLSTTLSVDWFLNLVVLSVYVVIIQSLLIWGTYSYLLYIAYHQIRYNINRITGIITIIAMLITLPLLMFSMHALSTLFII